MKTTRPNIIRIGNGLYRLDLRRKTFSTILETISNGKKTLDFPTKAGAQRKADEVDQLLTQYGSKKLQTLEAVMRIDPLDL
jgi:hypothetical protein